MKKENNSITIEDYIGLVRSIVSRYRNYNYPVEDLMQEGMIGLMEAEKRFDFEKGTSFATYAAFWVKKRIIDALNRERKESMDALSYDDNILNEEQENDGQSSAQEPEPTEQILDIPQNIPAEEQTFLNLHYKEKRTLKDIANIMGLSRERIRQLRQKALRRLRHTIQSEQKY